MPTFATGTDALATGHMPTFAPILVPAPIPRPPEHMVQISAGGVNFVGGMAIGGMPDTTQLQTKRQHGDRGGDTRKRRKRTCKACSALVKQGKLLQGTQERCAGAAPTPARNGRFFCREFDARDGAAPVAAAAPTGDEIMQ